MNDTPQTGADAVAARNLRYLRALVTTLSVTMIAGFLVLIFLFVTRFPGPAPAAPPLPDRLVLPAGAEPYAFTEAPGWYAVVTRDGRILIFDRETGAMRQEIVVDIQP